MNDLVVWQAAMDAKESPTAAPPTLKPMKPNESIWKPGDYLLEVELMKYALENRHVSYYFSLFHEFMRIIEKRPIDSF